MGIRDRPIANVGNLLHGADQHARPLTQQWAVVRMVDVALHHGRVHASITRRLLTAACETAPLTLVSAFSTFDLALDRFADEGGPLLAIGKDSGDPLERASCEFRPDSLRPSFLASHAWPNSNIRAGSHHFRVPVLTISCARYI